MKILNQSIMPKKIFWMLIFLSIIGGGMVWYATEPFGPGISGDAVHYLSGAENLGKGMGFTNYLNLILIQTPPLYSILLLAGSKIFSISVLESGRWINILAYSGIIFFGGIFFSKFHKITETNWAIWGAVLLLFGRSIFNISVNISQDTIFTLCSIGYFLLFHKYLSNPSKINLFNISILVGIMFFTRFVGLFVVLSGAITLLLIHKRNVQIAIRRIIPFGIVSATPTILWVILRNYRLTGTLVGQGISDKKPLENFIFSFERISNWFVPEIILGIIPPIIFICLGIIIIFLLSNKLQRKEFLRELMLPKRQIVWFFSAIYYFGMLIFTLPRHHFLIYDDRYYIELYLPVIYFFFILFELLIMPNIKYKQIVTPMVIIWLLYPAVLIYRTTLSLKNEGGKTYNIFNTNKLREGEVFKYINSLSDDSVIYSNCPRCMYLYTRYPANASPKSIDDLKNEDFQFMENNDSYFVWFKVWTYDGEFLPPEEIEEFLPLLHIENFSPDIKVFTLLDN